jgi:predicted RNA methylase
VDETELESARRARAAIEGRRHDAHEFRASLLSVPPDARDAWLDAVLGLDAMPDDGPELPRGCVPYCPCPVDALLRVVEHARVGAADVFVDVGSGLGRAATFVHLLTGAGAVGIEIQSQLVHAARGLAGRLGTSRVSFLEGDAARLAGRVGIGSVFFLYCPFSGSRLASVLDDLEQVARTRAIRVCCVDLPLPDRPWLTRALESGGDLAIYESARSSFGVSSARPAGSASTA